MINAFLTGSQVYGEPTEESDIDLVVSMSQPETIDLLDLLHDKAKASVEEYGNGQATVRIGKLNLIICYENEERFSNWITGTKYLKKTKPNNRDFAVSVFKRLFSQEGKGASKQDALL
jgi:predicted nucleotidyltransferase